MNVRIWIDTKHCRKWVLTTTVSGHESEVMYNIDFGDIIKDFADKIEFESEKSASEMKWNDFTYN